MACPEYPKIETLFDRDPVTFRVDEDRIRLPEFSALRQWEVTEKIDGTNVRVHFDTSMAHVESARAVEFYGRSDNAQMHPPLLAFLRDTFTVERMATTFKDAIERSVPVTLYGEGYGPKIQKGGGRYRPDTPSFRVFDVMVGGVWIRLESVREIAASLGIATVPVIGYLTLDTAVCIARDGFVSNVATVDGGDVTYHAEGIVAKSDPLMLDRMGRRVMWKLKARDFTGGKR